MWLDDRKLQVLNAIVQDYVETAEPVSSRTLVRKYRLGVSPATVRNEMSDLEDLGYLEQPHTSAGRVPSDKGYRFYVDRLMQTHKASMDEIRGFRDGFRHRAEHVETLMQATARVLSDITRYLTVVSGPTPRTARFRALYMHLVAPERALIVVLTDVGLIENGMVLVPAGTAEEDLRMISEIFSSKLAGTPVDVLGQAAYRELNAELKRYRSIVEQLLEVINSWPSDDSESSLYLDGTLNIMSQPEFHDIEKVRLVLSVLEQHSVIAGIFKNQDPGRVGVAIGQETGVPEMRDCSVVWTTFLAADKVLGSIGVLGPRRMDYARVVALVEFAKERLSDAISRNVG